jgi:hypothetical protein
MPLHVCQIYLIAYNININKEHKQSRRTEISVGFEVLAAVVMKSC